MAEKVKLELIGVGEKNSAALDLVFKRNPDYSIGTNGEIALVDSDSTQGRSYMEKQLRKSDILLSLYPEEQTHTFVIKKPLNFRELTNLLAEAVKVYREEQKKAPKAPVEPVRRSSYEANPFAKFLKAEPKTSPVERAYNEQHRERVAQEEEAKSEQDHRLSARREAEMRIMREIQERAQREAAERERYLKSRRSQEAQNAERANEVLRAREENEARIRREMEELARKESLNREAQQEEEQLRREADARARREAEERLRQEFAQKRRQERSAVVTPPAVEPVVEEPSSAVEINQKDESEGIFTGVKRYELDVVQRQESRKICGQNGDLDLSNPPPQLYFDAATYLCKRLIDANLSAKEQKKSFVLELDNDYFYLDYESNLLYTSLPEGSLYALSLMPLLQEITVKFIDNEREAESYVQRHSIAYYNRSDWLINVMLLWSARGRLPQGIDLNHASKLKVDEDDLLGNLQMPKIDELKTLWESGPYSLTALLSRLEISQCSLFSFYCVASANHLLENDQETSITRSLDEGKEGTPEASKPNSDLAALLKRLQSI